MRTAIYQIKNTINGKLYIGITANPVKRWWEHRNQTKKTHTKLYNAFKKYGVTAFSFTLLHWCDTREDARELENLVVETCDSIAKGYNMCPGGGGGVAGPDNPFYGKPLSPEVRAKMSDAAKKRGLNITAVTNGMAIIRAKEQDADWLAQRNAKISIANKNREVTEEWRKNLSIAWIERKKNFVQPGAKAVVCTETGEEFVSASEAARKYGLAIDTVCRDCRGAVPKNPRGRTVTFRYPTK